MSEDVVRQRTQRRQERRAKRAVAAALEMTSITPTAAPPHPPCSPPTPRSGFRKFSAEIISKVEKGSSAEVGDAIEEFRKAGFSPWTAS